MGLVNKLYTFTSGAVAISARVNSDFDVLYTLVNGNIDNENIKANAGIVDTKLATISTGGKVDGSAITNLANVPSGAGYLPSANISELIIENRTSDPTTPEDGRVWLRVDL